MRKIYNDVDFQSIQQGTIFNGAIADSYKNCDVYGVIITPRCDIANGKVNTYHYLPIIKLDDWKWGDFWTIFSHLVEKELMGNFTQLLSKYDISSNLTNSFSPKEIHLKCHTKISKQKDIQKFKDLADDLSEVKLNLLTTPSEKTFNYFFEKKIKLAKSIFGELKTNKRKGFYLIEDWEGSDNYYVVLLREIKKITVQTGDLLPKGVFLGEIKKIELSSNDLNWNLDGYTMLRGIKRIRSPYIEHLIQMFFQNFGRIGVTDHNNNLENTIINKFKQRHEIHNC